jgi:hypothetical protein
VGSRSRARARAQVSEAPVPQRLRPAAQSSGPRRGQQEPPTPQRGAAVAEPASASGQPAPAVAPRRSLLLAVAAVAQATEAAGLLCASVLVAIDTIEGKASNVNSGIALTVLGTATAVALGCVAAGLARMRPWSRTPALITQFFIAIFSIYLVHDLPEWGVPGLVLAATGLVTVLAPPSMRTLARRPEEPHDEGR